MARSRGFPQGRTIVPRSKRLTAWEPGPGGTTSLSIVSVGSFFVGSAISLVAGVSENTIIRLRGQLDFMLLSAGSAGDGLQGAFGIGIATLAAVTAGIASVPTPITEVAAENWLFWHALSVHSATTTDLPDSAFQRLIIDSKAMRKFTVADALYAAVEIGTETGVATSALRFDSRMLVKIA